MRARVLHRLDQLGYDVRRRRAVGVTHAQINDVLASAPGLGLGRVNLGEDIGRQAADTVELVWHRMWSARGEVGQTPTRIGPRAGSRVWHYRVDFGASVAIAPWPIACASMLIYRSGTPAVARV